MKDVKSIISIDGRWFSECKSTPFSDTELKLMSFLDERPKEKIFFTTRDLAKQLGLRPTQLNKAIRKLHAIGYLIYKPSGQGTKSASTIVRVEKVRKLHRKYSK